MKVAVIGCGTMGRTHAAEWKRMPGIRLAGVCDAQEGAARHLADSLETRAYEDFDRMIGETDPDIVDICLPTHLHKEFIFRTARSGKHVICEKPIALSASEAEEAAAECRKRGVRLFIGQVVRFFPSYADIRRKAADGTIGTPAVLHAKRMGANPGLAKPWYADSDRSGGVILDLMIHDIDFAQSLFGNAVSVYAMNRRQGDTDYALATLRFGSGEIAHLEAYWGFPGPFTTGVELAGTGGVIRFNSEEAVSLRVFKAKGAAAEAAAEKAAVPVPKSPSTYNPYYLELAHFADCVRTGREPEVTAEDACSALRTSLAVIESARTGRPVKLQDARKGENRHVYR
ncbi:Gfo/Idh/MocA family protein [Paenibacillus chitinolyticus]|uniref:Gfo/Idh/MocA family protein n=1 Tax=Paenibacillus chitinolyticus TaxID=79263 RepID=UPI0036DE5D4D